MTHITGPRTKKKKNCRYLARYCSLPIYFFITSMIGCSFSEQSEEPCDVHGAKVKSGVPILAQRFTVLSKLRLNPCRPPSGTHLHLSGPEKYKVSGNKKSKESPKRPRTIRGWDTGPRASSHKQLSAAICRLPHGCWAACQHNCVSPSHC